MRTPVTVAVLLLASLAVGLADEFDGALVPTEESEMELVESDATAGVEVEVDADADADAEEGTESEVDKKGMCSNLIQGFANTAGGYGIAKSTVFKFCCNHCGPPAGPMNLSKCTDCVIGSPGVPCAGHRQQKCCTFKSHHPKKLGPSITIKKDGSVSRCYRAYDKGTKVKVKYQYKTPAEEHRIRKEVRNEEKKFRRKRRRIQERAQAPDPEVPAPAPVDPAPAPVIPAPAPVIPAPVGPAPDAPAPDAPPTF